MGNGICTVCNKRNSKYLCNITGEHICQRCCDKQQLNHSSQEWEQFHQNKEVCKDQLLDKCLSCPSLTRNVGETVNFVDDVYGGFVISFEYKGKYVFSKDVSELNKKKKVLVETAGCEEPEDYFDLGNIYFELGDTENALKQFKKSAELSQDKNTFKLIGYCYSNLGELELANNNFKKALSIDENYSEVYRALGDLYNFLGQFEHSVDYYKQAIEKYRYDETLKDFNDSAIELNYYGLAIAYSKLNLHPEVIEASENFFKVVGPWEDLKDTVTLYKNGELSPIIDYSYDVYTFSTLYQLKALSYLELNNLDSAEDDIKRARWLSPEDVEIAQTEGIMIGRRHNETQIMEYRDTVSQLKERTENKLIDKLNQTLSNLRIHLQVECENFIIGDVNQMNNNNRTIKDSFNDSSFKGTTIIQGDGNKQNDEVNTAFTQLFSVIKEIQDELQRTQAQLNAESLQDAVNTEDTNKAKSLLALLKGTIGTVASLTTIAKFFGLSL